MKKVQDLTGNELLGELGVELEEQETGGYTARQERLIAGFEDVSRFYDTHGCVPEHDKDRDIFERLYAVRLDQLRKLPTEELAILLPLDKHGLLTGKAIVRAPKVLADDELLAELDEGGGEPDDIGVLRYVRDPEARRDTAAADQQVADRGPCKDFDQFKSFFEEAEADLAVGRRETRRFAKDASIDQGDIFILSGQLIYIADVGETYKTPNGEANGRLRVIYANGTESNLLMRSLQRALYKDENGRRLTSKSMGPLFDDTIEPDDIVSGTIYVLRSLSKQPEIAAMREVLHKIGVTGGEVGARIAGAEKDPTYLLSPVEVVATWKLANIRRHRFEQTIHRVFSSAQLQLRISDRFGNPVEPREWFVVPLPVIDEVMRRIQDETITDFIYDANQGRLKRV
jgi:T5orf172 domain